MVEALEERFEQMSVQHRMGSERRRKMIAEAAYFRAERRGFIGGDPVADWIAAEREVDASLASSDIDSFIRRLESQVDAASARLQEMRRNVAVHKDKARVEWKKEIEHLAELRDAFAEKLARMRRRGERVGQRARREAEKLHDELAEAVHRLGSRQK
jgi:hypothetical protein